MKFSNLKKQRGVVLAFSLMMLLLLTLAGTRMIQQNKQQLEMSVNDRILTQEFATAEGWLEAAKNAINSYPAHVDPNESNLSKPWHQCVPAANKQDIELPGLVSITGMPTGSSATVLSVKCLSVKTAEVPAGKLRECSSYSAGVVTCHPDKLDTSGKVVPAANGNNVQDNRTCTGNTVAELAVMFSNNTLATDGTASGATNICYQDYLTGAGGKCPSEIYTIQVISKTNGSERQIISDHVVGCGD